MATIVIQVMSMGLVFLTSFALAYFAGAETYGLYTYVFAIVNVAAGLSILGFDNLLVRDVAKYHTAGEQEALKGLLKTAFIASFTLASILTLIGGAVLVWGAFPLMKWGWIDTQTLIELKNNGFVFLLGLICIPLVALIKLNAAALIGLKKVVEGQLPEGLLKPLLFLVLLLGFWLFYGTLNGALVLLAVTLAILFSVLFGLRWLYANFKSIFQLTATISIRLSTFNPYLKAAFPFFLISIFTLIKLNVDKILLGTLIDYQELGIYNIALKLSELIRVLLVMVHTVIAPLIVNLHTENNLGELQRVVTWSARIVLLVSAPLALLFIFFGQWILSWYGADFVAGYWAIQVLCVAQLFNLATGFGASLLMMCGAEKWAFGAQVAAFMVELILHLLLIPQYGLNGAAMAVAIGVVFYNVLLVFLSIWKIGIDPTVLGYKR